MLLLATAKFPTTKKMWVKLLLFQMSSKNRRDWLFVENSYMYRLLIYGLYLLLCVVMFACWLNAFGWILWCGASCREQLSAVLWLFACNALHSTNTLRCMRTNATFSPIDLTFSGATVATCFNDSNRKKRGNHATSHPTNRRYERTSVYFVCFFCSSLGYC